MNALEIIKKYLTENKYDGFFSPYGCACKKEDIAECGQIFCDCEPGYLGPGNEDFDYTINREWQSKKQ